MAVVVQVTLAVPMGVWVPEFRLSDDVKRELRVIKQCHMHGELPL